MSEFTATKSNVSTFHKVMSLMMYIKTRMRTVPVYRHVYRNYLRVLLHIAKNNYPVVAIVRRDNHVIMLHNHSEAFYVTFLLFHNISYDKVNNSVSIPYVLSETGSATKVTMYGAIDNGDIVNIFVDNVYNKLPVRGKTVVDIGANIGDSPIYFALRGATRIIALEPFPKSYEMAKKNIELNHLSSMVTYILAGCSGSRGCITLDPASESGLGSTLGDSSKSGTEIPLLTLEDILAENNILSGERLVMKMDCEGCEYDVILSCPSDTIRRFGHIQIEYHYGYQDIKEKLEKCGFNVSVSTPEYLPPINNPHALEIRSRSQYVGYLYATRI